MVLTLGCINQQKNNLISDKNINSNQNINSQIYLVSPYQNIDWNKVSNYRANLHTHSNQSDGVLDVNEVIKLYADANYSILSITDHDTVNSKLATKTENVDSNMLLILGNEISSAHHFNLYFCDYLNDDQNFLVGGNQTAIFARENNCLMVINHPYFYNNYVDNIHDYYDYNWYLNLYKKYADVLFSLEVFNQGDRYALDNYLNSPRHLWDKLNYDLLPDKIVFGLSNDDFHSPIDGFRNYQTFFLEKLDLNSFKYALTNGNYYFSYQFDANGGKITAPIINQIKTNEKFVEINFENALTIEIITDVGEMMVVEKLNSNNFKFDYSNLKNKKFFRIVLKNNFGESYTQPFYFK